MISIISNLLRLSVCGLLYCLYVFTSVSFGQTPANKTDTLEVDALSPVAITASRLTTDAEESPMAISVLGKTFIQQGQQQIALNESLDAVAGVFSLNAENFAQDLRVSIRGFGARAAFGIRGIKLLVDGIPESTPDGQAQVDNIDVGIIDQIEIIRGPASGLYGNASGGVINIRTEQAPENPFIEGRLSFGSYGFQRYQLKAGQRIGKFQYMLYGARTQNTGYRENSKMKNNLLNGRFEFQPDSSSVFRLLLNYVNSPLAEDPGGLKLEQAEENPRQARDRNLSFQSGETLQQGRVALVYEKAFNKAHSFRLRSYYLSRSFANKLPFEFGGIVEFDRTYWGGGLNYLFKGQLLGMGYQFNLGMDIDKQTDNRQRFRNLQGQKGDMTVDQREEFVNTGIFLIQELKLSQRLSFTLGTRFDAINAAAKDNFLSNGDDSGKLNFWKFSPMTGLLLKLSRYHQLYVNIATSFDTPTLNELSNNPNAEGGFNSELNPQRATNYELGLKGQLGQKIKYDLAIFKIDLQDELVPFELQASPGRTFYRNAGRSQRIGAELSTQIYLTPQLSANLAYTYSDFTFQSYTTPNGVFDGNVLAAVPKHAGFLSVNYTNKAGLYTRIQTRFVGKMFTNDDNSVSTDPYNLISIRLGYNKQFTHWLLEPFIGVNNLFDTVYYANIRVNAFGQRYFEPAAGILIFGGLRVRI